MKIFRLLPLFVCSILFAQVNPSITVGQSLKEVQRQMTNDDAADQYNVKKTNNIILVSVKPQSHLNKNSIVQYYFNDNTLVKIKWTNSVPNPDGMLAFVYQNTIVKYGEPSITRIEGNKAYHWSFPNKIGFYYYYKGFSEWFQRTCFINVISLNQI